MPYRAMPDVPAELLRYLARLLAMGDLVAGRLPETPGNFWFASGNGRRAILVHRP
jgi:hypothetical protein